MTPQLQTTRSVFLLMGQEPPDSMATLSAETRFVVTLVFHDEDMNAAVLAATGKPYSEGSPLRGVQKLGQAAATHSGRFTRVYSAVKAKESLLNARVLVAGALKALDLGVEVSARTWYWRDLRTELANFGWVENGGSKHLKLENPSLLPYLKKYGVNYRPLAVKFEHMNGGIEPHFASKYASDVGLRLAHSGNGEITIDTTHPYAQAYQDLLAGASTTPTPKWLPEHPTRLKVKNIDFVPVAEHDLWKVARKKKALLTNPVSVAPLAVLRLEDGIPLAEDNILLEAVKQLGMEDIPVVFI